MSDSGNSSTRPRVGDENSMSGELLAELIRAHRQPNNAVHLSLEGAEYLAAGDASIGDDTPTDASQAPESAYTPLTGARAYTRTVNLEVAHARLQHMLADADDENAARVQRTYHEPALDDGLDERTALEERDVYLERENRSVLWLRNRGVPLLYNPELLLAVRADPRRFEGMLRAFYLHPPMENDAPEICFFERQALRWEEFNRFQLHCRGVSGAILDDERIFEAAYAALIVREADSAREWKQLMANPILGHKPSRKEAFRRKLEEDAVYLRDRGCSTFVQYQEATRARLARHGFEVPQGFAPLRDVTAAGRRERWLEYAAYECWHMEHYRRDVELYREGHDEAYAALREAVPLQERETAEFLATEDAAIQLRVERDLARARCGQLRLDRALLRRRRSSSAAGGGACAPAAAAAAAAGCG
ncbi:hypothetical protein PWT90_10781 [Aphanocladium album]|nr:hypothetical protein PWT90_10781 [Aphanocladium album]